MSTCSVVCVLETFWRKAPWSLLELRRLDAWLLLRADSSWHAD
ncbi:hypothetical protein [Synechococcus sp. ROS8604]|nr:hypothetical protein [Synechococcus sp. ROS8604]QNI89058.1 hypothetical protein SynROS8604_02429 [Synechococcus sp. ROS8604]